MTIHDLDKIFEDMGLIKATNIEDEVWWITPTNRWQITIAKNKSPGLFFCDRTRLRPDVWIGFREGIDIIREHIRTTIDPES